MLSTASDHSAVDRVNHQAAAFTPRITIASAKVHAASDRSWRRCTAVVGSRCPIMVGLYRGSNLRGLPSPPLRPLLCVPVGE